MVRRVCLLVALLVCCSTFGGCGLLPKKLTLEVPEPEAFVAAAYVIVASPDALKIGESDPSVLILIENQKNYRVYRQYNRDGFNWKEIAGFGEDQSYVTVAPKRGGAVLEVTINAKQIPDSSKAAAVIVAYTDGHWSWVRFVGEEIDAAGRCRIEINSDQVLKR